MRWVVVLFLVLSACTSAEEERRQAQEREKARMNAIWVQCVQYGFKSGTPEHSQCMMQLDMADRQASEARRAAVLQHLLRNQPRVPMPQPPVTTNCTRLGNTVNCTTQ